MCDMDDGSPLPVHKPVGCWTIFWYSNTGRQLRPENPSTNAGMSLKSSDPCGTSSRLSWFFPEGPHGALADPPGHIFRGPGPQELMGRKAHHVPVQMHCPDSSTCGTFHRTRLCLPQAQWFHID